METDLQGVGAFKVMLSDAAALDALTAEQVRGKVLLVEVPDGRPRRHGGLPGAAADRWRWRRNWSPRWW